MSEVEITRLEKRTVQVTWEEDGVVLYFNTEQKAERAFQRIKYANDSKVYALGIWKKQQENSE